MFWANKTSLTLPLFFEVPVPIGKCTVMYLFVRGINFTYFYDLCIGIHCITRWAIVGDLH